MDQQELQQKIAEYYAKLPPEAQEVFSKMEWLETLNLISKNYGLNDEQIQTLGTETMLVLLSITHLDEYERILRIELKMPLDSIKKMLGEIENSVLKDIRPQLIETYQKNTTEPEIENTELFNKSKLDEHFSKLPADIQKAVIDSNYQLKLYTIAKKHNLTVEQMSIMEDDVVKVILGTIKPEKFEETLYQDLGIKQELNVEIVNEINNEILKNIRANFVPSTEPVKTPLPLPTGQGGGLVSTPAGNIEGTILAGGDTDVLTNNKIEIMSPELKEGVKEIKLEEREDILNIVENPEKIPMKISVPVPTPDFVPTKKLFESFKTEETTTRHDLPSVSKPQSVQDIPKKPTVDPYREIPE